MDRNTVAMSFDAASPESGGGVSKKQRKSRSKKIVQLDLAAAEPSVTESAKAAVSEPTAMPADANADDEAHDAGLPTIAVHNRIGSLTRTLHDALRELGHDKGLADARATLPDARERLSYIARLTGDAADKVLNAVDSARSVQEQINNSAANLAKRWDTVENFAGKSGRATPAGKQLINETTQFFSEMQISTDKVNSILTDIMMAQDFHDLTGQVIRRIVDLAQTVEEQLVALLLETTPEHLRKVDNTQLAGPVVNGEGRTDVVTDQGQVDDLLASLGF